jgi:Chaperone of endosialidase
MRVMAGGWVGIGTNSPAQLLEVSGGRIRATMSNPFIEWNGTYPPTPNLATVGIRSAGELVTRTNTNNTTISDWETKAGTGTNAFPNDCYYVGRRSSPTVTNASYFFHIDATGNVGINTTTQNALLHVNHPNQNGYSALTDPHIVQISSTTTNSNLVFALNGAGGNSSVIQSKASASTAWGLSLNPYGGNVGVGVINPQAKFHTVGMSRFEQNAATIQLVGATAGHSYIEYYSQGMASGRQGYIGYPTNGNASLHVYNESATGDLNFGVGGTVAGVDMTVKNNGFVGIGTSVPNQKLTVDVGNIEIGNNNDNMLVSRNNAQGLNHQMIGTYMGWDTRGVYLAGYNQNNLGGAGTYNATNRIYAGGSFGTLPISATAFTVVSAKRYKQNILPVAYGLSSILNLNPVQYQYTFEQEKATHVGFIAEEVEKVIPEIVVKQTNPETANYGQAMGVNYTELVPVLVKGMQEQQSEIETLKKQNARLEAELQEIKKMLLEKK